MNSLPTPESSPAGQFGKADAKKLKNAESEKKTSKKVRRRDTRLSRSLPGLNQSAKIANTIRPKSLFPKVALIISPKNSKSPKASKSPKTLKSPKTPPKKSQKGPKTPKTPKTPTNNEVTTPNGLFSNSKEIEKETEEKKEIVKSPSKKLKLNSEATPVEETGKDNKVKSPTKKLKLNGEATPVEETRKDNKVKSPAKKIKLNGEATPVEETRKDDKVKSPTKKIKLNGEATPVEETRKDNKVNSPTKKLKLNGEATPVEEIRKDNKVMSPPKKIKLNGEAAPVKEIRKESNTRKSSPSKRIKLNGRLPVEETGKEIESPPEKMGIEWKHGLKYSLGQLAWARVGNFPYWPCVVTLEPESMLFSKTQVRGHVFANFIHVQYFGDNERHSWVSEFNILPFTGADDFEKRASKFLELVRVGRKKSDTKCKNAFIVSGTHRPKWEIAISEATEILGISNEDRASMFAPAPLVMKNKNPVSSKKKKRKLSLGSDIEVPAKRFKNAVPGKVQSTKDDPKSRKSHSKSRKSKDTKSNLNPSKKNSKMNKSTGDLSKLSEKVGRLNGKFSKSTGNLSKLFERTSKVNGRLGKDAEKSHKVNGKLHKSLRTCKVEIYDSLAQTPPTPPSSLLSNSWDEERKNSTFDILMALHHPGIEDEIKKERWSDSVQENGEDFSNRSICSDLEDDSSEDFDPRNLRKFVKKGKNKSSSVKEGSSVKVKLGSRPLNLFKGIKQERVCQICEQTGKLVRCKGPCFSYYHLSCVKPGESPENSEVEDNLEDELFQDLKEIRTKIAENESFSEKPEAVIKVEEPAEEETFKCIDCLSGVAPACFICNDREIERERCSAVACGRYYHPTCLKTWPQSHWQGGRLTCPYHMCHTCNSDNPQNGHVGKTNEKLARCVRCPSSYHASTSCLPAGSEIITGNQIICPKHYKCNQPPLNATWCFLCTKGGSLICCDTCPTSFHPECLGIKAPDGAYICEDCETGRLPLYGEIVWVKLGSYRWWPSRICLPYEIPHNVEALNHRVGEFCVMFLGTRNYYWVHRGRAFLYQEGDACTKPSGKKKGMDEAFKKALDEASEFHQLLKKQRAAAKDQERGLKPPPYVKLKVNKPVGTVKPIETESIVACACSANKDNPCAPDTDCLNRMLCVECSPDICPAGSKCQNQAFVQRLYPAMEAFHTDGKGWGLRSLESIKGGQFVIEYVGEVIDEAEYKRRLHRKKELKNENYYFLTIDTGRMIDAEPKGNLSRFMNHSCQPNCETQKWTVNGDTRIGLFAVRDIESGEELTFNYNLACDGEKRKPCLCGSSNCSGFIGLKVQKQQISAIQERKLENSGKQKRQKKARKVICWSCRKEVAGELPVKCDQKSCSKKYHKGCVVLKNSETKFSCPWHHCSQCGRKTTSHCYICQLAYCQVHLNKYLAESKRGLICKTHQNGLPVAVSPIIDEKDIKEKLEKLEPDFEKRSFSPFGSSSPILSRKSLIKKEDQSSRVSIVEVQLSSEDNDECLTEDTDDPEDSARLKEKSPRRSSSRRGKRRLEELNALNSEQLLAIIGGGV